MRFRPSVLAILLLLGSVSQAIALGSTPPNTANPEVPSATRCVTADGTGFEACGRSTSATPTQSSVSGSATNKTLLAANSARIGATITNNSDQVLYVKLGVAATTSSYTAALDKQNANGVGGYMEVPFGYTGQIDGIWASGTSGNAQVTEFVK